MIIAIYISSI